MTVVFDLSKQNVESFFKEKKPKKKAKSAAERREGNSAAYLAKIRQLPCCVCRKPGPSEAHHLRCAGGRGTSMKAEDKTALPLCTEHHTMGGPACVHYVGSRLEHHWFVQHGIDCLALSSALWANKESFERMQKVLAKHWEKY